MVKKTNSARKKMLSKDAISDTTSDDRLFSVFFSICQDGKVPNDIPRGSIYRYTKILKDKRIIKYKSYGVWEVDNKELATKFRAEHYQKDAINKSLPGATLSPKHFPVTDKRGHRLLLTITTPELVLGKVRKYLDYKGRGNPKWVDGGRAGRYLKCWFGGAGFSIYGNKVVVEFHKSFYAEHHIDTEVAAQAHFLGVIRTFEDNVGQSIRIGKELLVVASMEFEKVNSDFAKYCFDRGLNIRFTAGDFKYWQDGSGGTRNEEGNKAKTMDALEGVAQVDVMRSIADYAEITGGRNILLDMAKQLNNLTQTLNSPSDIVEKRKNHKDLPSYFG